MLTAISHPTLTGAFLIIFGSAIRWQIGRRRFNRRTITGLEWFTSYPIAVITKALEWLAVVAAKLMIFAGILFILAASV